MFSFVLLTYTWLSERHKSYLGLHAKCLIFCPTVSKCGFNKRHQYKISRKSLLWRPSFTCGALEGRKWRSSSIFITNLMHKFFIVIHLLCSSTCLRHYYALSSGGQIVLVQHLVSSLSLGDRSVHRLREESPLVVCVLNGHLKRVTVQNAVLIQFVLLKMGIIVLETCRGL